MNFIENFLNVDLTESPEIILNLFIKSIYQIRCEELSLDIDFLEKNGDEEAVALIKKYSVQEICLHTDNVKLVDDVPSHAQQLLNSFNENHSAIVFRGTRLPLSNSSFKNGYIHTTPQFATSAAYAVGISNSYGGIGRLLTSPNENLGVGFIHGYEAPLTSKVYKNFQFEKFLNENMKDSELTLHNLKEDLESFAKLEPDSFNVEYFSENNLYGNPNNKINMSPNMQKWYNFITSTKCMDTPYYEVMLPEGNSSKFTFLINEKCQLIKLDLNNPKTKQVLQRLQNLLLKDFYEIVPLNKLADEVDLNISTIKEQKATNKIDEELFALLKEEKLKLNEIKKDILDMIKKAKESPFISKSDIEHIMSQSQQVGSTNMIGEPHLESKIVYPSTVEDFINTIHKKIKIIELPLKLFLSSKNNFFNVHIKQPNNILDKFLDKIEESTIPYSLKINEIENKEVVLELMSSIERRFNIKNTQNPTIGDFVNTLKEFKKQSSLRERCFKSSLIDFYQPMIGFITRRIIDKYKDIKIEDTIDNNIKGVNSSVVHMRNKLLDKLDILLSKNNEEQKNKYKI